MDNKRLIGLSVGLVILILVGVITFSSIIFETQEPSLESSSIPTHWNLQDEIQIGFSDESGIRDYRVQVIFDNEILSDEKEVILNKPKSVKIPLPKPSTTLKNGTSIQYKIEVTDWSSSHFFTGNMAKIDLNLIVDTTPPEVTPIASSYQITRGGSAVVAVEVKDMALEDVRLSNGTDEFALFKYLDENIYIGIIAWPLKNKFFAAQLVAKDKAGNITKHNIPLVRNINVPYYRSNIRIKEDFLSGKLDELLSQIDKKHLRNFENDIEKFAFFNEEIRGEDEKRILKACSDLVGDKSFIDEGFHAFVPLRGSKVVGSFGDFRTYFLGKEKISEATHLGIDVASVKNAPVIASNNAVVLLKSHLGLYGNTLLLYHGFGVSSIYAHLQESYVEVSDLVHIGQEIGKTGTTGWAFGDHLHFGILIQGHFVRLSEWLDQKWIDDNVISVLSKARSFYQTRIVP
ncbi:M23 family metallopeptidase [Helicobacter cinaedi]|uniref:Putative M23/M37 family peptidase n=1 Tax=Helicobacter cinaedi TaxID=213 RepID=A0A377JNW3_9HELI|nr:M23 family metallopeptidase [Helicobacter cinaedi]STP08722.1 putative M23/M37 family peptidase [Helicobacter cinaedi]